MYDKSQLMRGTLEGCILQIIARAPSYGYAIAADTGGFVKKGKFTVDLFMNSESECVQWGARDVVIYVL